MSVFSPNQVDPNLLRPPGMMGGFGMSPGAGFGADSGGMGVGFSEGAPAMSGAATSEGSPPAPGGDSTGSLPAGATPFPDPILSQLGSGVASAIPPPDASQIPNPLDPLDREARGD